MRKLFASALALSLGALLLTASCTPKEKWPTQEVKSVSVTKSDVVIRVGNSYTVSDIVIDPVGSADPELVSSDTNIATTKGLVITGESAGTTDVTVKAGNQSCVIKVTVKGKKKGGKRCFVLYP